MTNPHDNLLFGCSDRDPQFAEGPVIISTNCTKCGKHFSRVVGVDEIRTEDLAALAVDDDLLKHQRICEASDA